MEEEEEVEVEIYGGNDANYSQERLRMNSEERSDRHDNAQNDERTENLLE